LKYALEKVVEELSSDERQLLNESSAKERSLSNKNTYPRPTLTKSLMVG